MICDTARNSTLPICFLYYTKNGIKSFQNHFSCRIHRNLYVIFLCLFTSSKTQNNIILLIINQLCNHKNIAQFFFTKKQLFLNIYKKLVFLISKRTVFQKGYFPEKKPSTFVLHVGLRFIRFKVKVHSLNRVSVCVNGKGAIAPLFLVDLSASYM